MRFGSLFAGIGGFDLGLERSGMQCAWQVEIDPWCRQVLARHWPDVPRYEDVRDVGAGNLEWVDVIAGGFPCQDISSAGKREGIRGKRSGLWTEFARIIRELRPRFVIVENVAALLVRGMGTVLGDLAASGYDAEWQMLPAAAFGAPHIRQRVFIVAYPQSSRNQRERIRLADSQIKTLSEINGTKPHGCRQNVAYTPSELWRKQKTRDGRKVSTRGGTQSRQHNHWDIEPNVGRVADGIPHQVDRLRGLGNAVVPQVAEWLGRRILEADHGP